MKSIKCLVVLVCMTFGFAGTAKGQIHSREALFYVYAGESLLNDPSINIVYVDDDSNKIFMFFAKMRYIEKMGFAYFDDPKIVSKWDATVLEFDYSIKLSKSDKNVYTRYGYGLAELVVFPNDKSGYVSYPRGEVERKEQYVRVDRSKFNIKKDSNYDFLYE